MKESRRPWPAIESRKSAMRGSGRGRIISEMTFVSISHASGAAVLVSNTENVPKRHG